MLISSPVVLTQTESGATPSQPFAFELKGSERHETFVDRPDKLRLRIRQCDHSVEHRLYDEGRPDGVREVECRFAHEHGLPNCSRIAFRAGRYDSVVSFEKVFDAVSGSIRYTVEFSDEPVCRSSSFLSDAGSGEAGALAPRSDGVVRVCLDALSDGTSLQFTTDGAVFGINHVAVQLNPSQSNFELCEIYQDMTSRTLRLARLNELGTRSNLTLHRNFNVEDSLDERYEPSRLLVMQLAKMVADLERELSSSLV